MKRKAHKGGHKGTGPAHHPDMSSYVHHGQKHHGKDEHAHPSHHAANAEHDMEEGFSPSGDYCEEGGEGMAGNESTGKAGAGEPEGEE